MKATGIVPHWCLCYNRTKADKPHNYGVFQWFLSEFLLKNIAFYNDTSHVGIVGGKDTSGNVLVIHCSSGYNNVVVTTGGFGFAVRPNCY